MATADFVLGSKNDAGYYVDPTSKYEEMYSGHTGLHAMLLFLLGHVLLWSPLSKLLGYLVKAALNKLSPVRSAEHDQRCVEMLKKGYGVDMPPAGAGEFGAELFGIGFQHITGMLLCVPAVFPSTMSYYGITDPAFALFLAKQGALAEVGWELGDSLFRAYVKLVMGDPNKTQPNSFLMIMAIHHFMGIAMVVPMNVHFGGNVLYYEAVFMLQGAAAIGLMSQQIGFMLDIRNAGELLFKKLLVVLTFACMWYSRGINYGYVLYQLVQQFLNVNPPNYQMVGFVCLGALIMGLLNILFIVDATKAFGKFMFTSSKDFEAKKKA